ncbi:MAG: tRNA guanosine(34) transglycosylase Tgt [Chloroflexi bacterium]|nr:tRNA guanosine(34) transglycosylase Tgt [Chloroflexota bacterium]MCL5275801.1 tRNA guanosine(34) transglycosylase Tgt [Chloroflexota bacterium]
MSSQLHLPHGDLDIPAFLPDATLGVVRSLDSADLERCGTQALVMNTFHLMQRPGSSTVQALGGLHRMSGWPHPIVTDSGGFQAYSLIRQNPKNGSLNNQGIIFRPEGSDRKLQLTPEKTIQLQVSYGSDIVICLDDCTNAEDPIDTQKESVTRTIAWARRCKEAYTRLIEQKEYADGQRPLLFGVVQGGSIREERIRCADALLEIGFDGYGYGGWPIDNQGNLLTDIVGYTREIIPSEYPMHALGIGHPPSIVACTQIGYRLFDSAMPTRDARHARLYTFNSDPALRRELSDDWFAYVYISDDKHIKDNRPISPWCDCLCCTRYSLGYLHHLYKINDSAFFRLATIHNLRFMAMLMAKLNATT